MNDKGSGPLLIVALFVNCVDANTEGANRFHCSQAVFAVEKSINAARPVAHGGEHDRTMGDALVAGNAYFSGDGLCSVDFEFCHGR